MREEDVTRLWVKNPGSHWRKLPESADFHSLDLHNDVFMLETHINGAWPRDGFDQERRDYEVNDIVDLYIKGKWDVGLVKKIKGDKILIQSYDPKVKKLLLMFTTS